MAAVVGLRVRREVAVCARKRPARRTPRSPAPGAPGGGASGVAAAEAPAQRERPAGAGFGGKAAPAKGEESAPQPPKTLADFTAADGTVDLEAMEAAGLYSSKLQVDEAALADEDDEDDFENVFFNADGTPMSAAKLDALRAYDPDEASAALAAALAEGAPAGVDDGAEEGDDGLVWGAEESADETEVVVDEVSELSGETSTENEEDEGDAYKVVDEDGNEYWFDAAGNMVGGEFDLGGDEDEDGEDAPDVFADARDEVVVEVGVRVTTTCLRVGARARARMGVRLPGHPPA